MTKSIIVTHIYTDATIELTRRLTKVVAERTLKVIVSLSLFWDLIIRFNVFANTPKNEQSEAERIFNGGQNNDRSSFH